MFFLVELLGYVGARSVVLTREVLFKVVIVDFHQLLLAGDALLVQVRLDLSSSFDREVLDFFELNRFLALRVVLVG